jgi:hypothetical protein
MSVAGRQPAPDQKKRPDRPVSLLTPWGLGRDTRQATISSPPDLCLHLQKPIFNWTLYPPRQRHLHYTGRIPLVGEVGGQICANETKCEQSFHSRRIWRPVRPATPCDPEASLRPLGQRAQHGLITRLGKAGGWSPQNGKQTPVLDVSPLGASAHWAPPIPLRRQADSPAPRLPPGHRRPVKAPRIPRLLPARRSPRPSRRGWSPS